MQESSISANKGSNISLISNIKEPPCLLELSEMTNSILHVNSENFDETKLIF